MQEDSDLKNILNCLEIDDIEKVKTDIKNEILINRPKRTYKPKNQKVNNKMRGRPPTKDVILNINDICPKGTNSKYPKGEFDIKNSNEKTDDIKQSVNEVASVLEKNNDIPPPHLPKVKQEEVRSPLFFPSEIERHAVPPQPPARSSSIGYTPPPAPSPMEEQPRPLTRDERIRQIMGF